MFLLACPQCKTAISIIGGGGASAFPVEMRHACPSCPSSMEVLLEAEVDPTAMTAMTVHHLSVEEAIAATMGLGFPSERTCCKEVIEPLLASVGIKVRGRQLPTSPPRYYFDYLELPDGTRIYAASSTRGACFYRVTEPHSYVKEALRE